MRTLCVLHYNLKILSCFGGNNYDLGRAEKETKPSCSSTFCAEALAVRLSSSEKGPGGDRHSTGKLMREWGNMAVTMKQSG